MVRMHVPAKFPVSCAGPAEQSIGNSFYLMSERREGRLIFSSPHNPSLLLANKIFCRLLA